MALARSYAQRTQGTPQEMNFNEDSGNFSHKFMVDIGVKAPTVLYLNQSYYYPAGYDIAITSEGQTLGTDAYEMTDSENFLEITITDTNLDHRLVTIKITPKPIDGSR